MAYTADTTVGELLDDPKAKALLEKLVPQLKNVGAAMLTMARPMSLKTVAGFPQAGITPEKLKEIVAELAKL